MSDLLRIAQKPRGNSKPLANNKKSIIYHLKNMSLDKIRIYTKEGHQKELMNAINGML